MTRKITVNGVKVEVSKNEAKQASLIVDIPSGYGRQLVFDTWLVAASPEARARRIEVGKALRLKVPE